MENTKRNAQPRKLSDAETKAVDNGKQNLETTNREDKPTPPTKPNYTENDTRRTSRS